MKTKKPSDRIINSMPFDLNREQYDKLRGFIGEIAFKKGFNSALDEVEKIIDDWYDTSIKDTKSKIALLITNGGYMNKIDFKEKIKEMRK